MIVPGLRLMPDAEELLSGFLRSQAEVTALVADRIYTSLPKEKVWPLVRLTRIGGSPTTAPADDALLSDAPVLQVEVWGGPKKIAWLTAETIRAVVADRIVGVHTPGVVEGFAFGTARYLPDESFDPAKPRVLFDLTLHTRPVGDRLSTP